MENIIENTECEGCGKTIRLSEANMIGNTFCNKCFLKLEE